MQGAEGEDIKKIRDKDVVGLRKQAREEIFLKRRNMESRMAQEGS